MASKFRIICTSLIGSLFLVSASYSLTINQDTNSGALQIQAFQPVGQSFTATDTDVGYVGLMIAPFNQFFNDLSLTMALYSGEGNFSADAELVSQEFVLTNNYSGWLDLSVSNIAFTQDAKYTIGIFNNTPQWGASINWSANPYNGGTAFFGGSAQAAADLQFHVGPGNTASTVPEPTTMVLLGTGLLGIVAAKKRKK